MRERTGPKGIAAFAWHFLGLAASTTGAVMLFGWPAALITLGTWAVAATMFDAR